MRGASGVTSTRSAGASASVGKTATSRAKSASRAVALRRPSATIASCRATTCCRTSASAARSGPIKRSASPALKACKTTSGTGPPVPSSVTRAGAGRSTDGSDAAIAAGKASARRSAIKAWRNAKASGLSAIASLWAASKARPCAAGSKSAASTQSTTAWGAGSAVPESRLRASLTAE